MHATTSRNPHLVLILGACLVLAEEYLRATVGVVPWFPLQVVTAATALGLCWRSRDRFRLALLLVVAVLFYVGWLLVRRHAVLVSNEPGFLYAPTGQHLLDGNYPRSEYPVGAVLLFALEALLGGARTHFVHAFLMVPFQLAAVSAVWSLRTGWSGWFAAVVAFWPVNAWFWEWRFDLVPTALVAAGLAFALRGRWVSSGCTLAIGFTVKWTPGLCIPVLVAYLLVARQALSALRLAVSSIGTIAVLYVPFLIWSPSNVLVAYSRQGGRSITDESVWHLPLQLLHLEGRHGYAHPAFVSVDPPAWANTGAIAVQIAALAAILWLATRARTLRDAISLAALMPVVFLATNRVFSVQYFSLFLVAWAIAASLLVDSSRQAIVATAAVCAATTTNAFIEPVPIPRPYMWELMSAARFTVALALTAWLAARVLRPARTGGLVTDAEVPRRASRRRIAT